MNAERRTIDRVRDILRSRLSGVTPDVQDASDQYLKLCSTVNQRLQEAAGLLARGLRTEAKHVVSTEPNLLDLARMLQSEDLAAWAEMSHSLGLTPPTAIPEELVEMLSFALEEGHQEGKELDKLLRLYRRAVFIGTKRDRILLLRRICRVDLTNTMWKQDLRTLEEYRQRELFNEVENALRREDATQLDLLKSELLSPDWSAIPAATFVKDFETKYRAVRSKKLGVVGAELSEKITTAHCALDFSGLDGLLARWFELVKDTDFRPDAAVKQKVDEAVEWEENEAKRLDRESKFEKSLAALELMVFRGAQTSRELESTLSRTQAIGLPLPPDSLLRAETRLTDLRKKEKRAIRLKQLLVATASIVVIGLITGAVLLVLEYKQRASWVASMEDRMRRQDWTGATVVLSRVERERPTYAKSAEIDALRSKIARGVQAEGQRREELVQVIKQLGDLSQKEFEPIAQADQLISQARKLASSPSEVASIDALAAGIEKARKRAQQSVDEKFSTLVASATAGLQLLKATDPLGDLERFRRSLKEISDGLAAAEALDAADKTLRGALPGLKADVGAANHRLEEGEAKAAENRKALEEVYSSLPDLDAFQRAVAKTLERPGLQSDLVRRLSVLSEGCRAYKPTSLAGEWNFDASGAGRQKCFDLLRDAAVGAGPWKSTLDQVSTDFAWIDRLTEFKATLAQLKTVDLYANLMQCEVKDLRTGQRHTYYFKEKPKPDGSASGSGAEAVFYFKGEMYKDNFELEEQKFSLSVNLVDAKLVPHAQFLAQLAEKAGSVTPSAFGKFLVDQLNSLVQDKSMNPVVAMIFAQKLLDPFSKMNDPQLARFDGLSKSFSKYEDNTYWLSQSDKDAVTAKAECRGKLDGVPDLSGELPAWNFRRALHLASLNRRLRCVGQVQLTAPGGPFVLRDKSAGELWIIETQDRGKVAVAVVVGTPTAEGYVEIGGIRARLVDGQPLFSPGDGVSTEALAKKLADASGLEDLDRQSWSKWPPMWPGNCRSVPTLR